MSLSRYFRQQRTGGGVSSADGEQQRHRRPPSLSSVFPVKQRQSSGDDEPLLFFLFQARRQLGEEVVLRRFQAPNPDLLLCSNRCRALVLCLHWTTAVLRLCVVVYSTESEARL
nr:hypothetical protein Iba_chr01aCG10080 [Ipomoea batatas]